MGHLSRPRPDAASLPSPPLKGEGGGLSLMGTVTNMLHSNNCVYWRKILCYCFIAVAARHGKTVPAELLLSLFHEINDDNKKGGGWDVAPRYKILSFCLQTLTQNVTKYLQFKALCKVTAWDAVCQEAVTWQGKIFCFYSLCCVDIS